MWSVIQAVHGGYIATTYSGKTSKQYAFLTLESAESFIESHGGFVPKDSCAVACILAGAGLHEEEV